MDGRKAFAAALLLAAVAVVAQELPGDLPKQKQPVEQLIAKREVQLPSGAIIMTLRSHCPDGFTRVDGLDDRFVKGAPRGQEPGANGGAATHKHKAELDLGHSQAVAVSGETDPALGDDARIDVSRTGIRVAGMEHTHRFGGKSGGAKGAKNFETEAASSEPRFKTVLFCSKD